VQSSFAAFVFLYFFFHIPPHPPSSTLFPYTTLFRSSGILKCPCCGKSLYGNIAKAHSKDKKTRYYYYCKNTLGATGHKCTFRVNIEQTEMNRMVAAIISAMVNDPQFSKAIKAKIGTSVDTEDLEKQLVALQAQLRQTLGIK